MSLKLERELIEIPYSYLRLVRPGRDCMVPVPGCPDFVTCFREVKVLDELNVALHLLPYDPLPFALGSALLGEPVWKGGRGGRCIAIDGVNFHRAGVGKYTHGGASTGVQDLLCMEDGTEGG